MIETRHFGMDPNGIGTVLLSRLHGGHFSDLPFFLFDALFCRKRDEPLTIAGAPGTEDRMASRLPIATLEPRSHCLKVAHFSESRAQQPGEGRRGRLRDYRGRHDLQIGPRIEFSHVDNTGDF